MAKKTHFWQPDEKKYLGLFCREFNSLSSTCPQNFKFLNSLGARAKTVKFVKISQVSRSHRVMNCQMTNFTIQYDSLTRCESNAVVRLSKFDSQVFLIFFSKKSPNFTHLFFFPPLRTKISKNRQSCI